MSRAVAFLAGMGTGFLNAREKTADRERQKKIDDRAEEEYQFRIGERNQSKADKEALRVAGSDVKVQEVPGLALDERDMDAMPPVVDATTPPTTYKAGAASFAERGLADTEASKQNTPAAKRERTAATMASQGNMLGADQLRTSGVQGEAAQIAIDNAKRDQATQLFDDGLRKATAKGPEALAQFMSESSADGQGGAMKFKSVPSPDGKSWQMHAVGEDGTLKPMGGRFANDETGYTTAAFMLSRGVKPEAKLAHSLALDEAKRRQNHDDKSLSIAQQNADTNERFRRDQAAQQKLNAAHSQRIAAGKTTEGGAITVSLKDMRDFEGDLSGYIKDQFPMNEAVDAKERGTIQAAATSMKSLGTSIFLSNASVGIPLTAGSVMQAMELASNRQNVRIADVSGVPHEAVVVNGQTVLVSGPMQAKPPVSQAAPGGGTPPAGAGGTQPPQPATNPPPTAATAAQAGVQAPAAAPNVIDRIRAESLQKMVPLAQQFKQAQAQFVAAAKSGDQRAIATYMQQADALRKQLHAQAGAQFGNGAEAALQQLLSSN
jgi:hypothetical protein